MPEKEWNANFRLTDYSDDVLAKVDDKLYAGLIACGIKAEKYAKNLCPTDTSRLKNSITYSVKTQPANMHYTWGEGKKSNRPAGEGDTISHGGEKKLTLYLGTNVWYARYVEFQSRKPKPFLKPAIENHLNLYRRILKESLQ